MNRRSRQKNKTSLRSNDNNRSCQKTGLPLDNCIVIGSGLLDALGLREAGDIDLVVDRELFDTLNGSHGYVYALRYGLDVLDKDDQEIWLAWG